MRSFFDWASEAEQPCPNCHLRHLGQCPFVMGQPCCCCGEPVTEVSMGGDRICGYCDTGACNPDTIRHDGQPGRPKTRKCIEHHQGAMRRFYEKMLELQQN